MTAPHPYVAIRSRDQWRRVAHFNTELTVREEGVSLARDIADADIDVDTVHPSSLFLAFDPYCRLLTADPESGEVGICREVDSVDAFKCTPLFEAKLKAVGEFKWIDQSTNTVKPSGLSVDSASHLFLSEAQADRISIFDLVDRRLIRFAILPAKSMPGDSDADGMDVYVCTLAGLGKLSVSTEFRLLDGDLKGRAFDRVAVSNGVICVLEGAGTKSAKVIPWSHPERAYAAPFATDIVFADANSLVIAFRAGELFEKHIVNQSGDKWSQVKDGYLRAKGYNGRGIVRSSDGRIGYFSLKRFRYALPINTRYETRGRIISFALDSVAYQNNWGLAFIDACIPKGCEMRVVFYASDEVESDFPIIRSLAKNDGDYGELFAPERSPSMPSDTTFEPFAQANIKQANKIYRRGKNDELVWDEFRHSDRLVTYETPVNTPLGRYLWVMIELAGSGIATPTLSGLRVQKQGHKLLKHLPKLFSRDQGVENYLRRYLALPEAILTEFDVSGLTRHVLLDPDSCREEWLTWLAGFVGLAFDERFNPDTRRQLIAEAAWLFRFRGTLQGLQRFIEIYADNHLGFETVVQIVERFRFRGHSTLQDPDDENLNIGTVLGVDYRLGTGISGEAEGEIALDSDSGASADPYAHRFVVLIAANLSTDQSDVINHIIAIHRPAHTVFEVCTVDAGMRISRGSYLQVNSFVGQSAGFMPIHLNSGTLGRNGVLGIAKTASTSTGGKVGLNARLG